MPETPANTSREQDRTAPQRHRQRESPRDAEKRGNDIFKQQPFLDQLDDSACDVPSAWEKNRCPTHAPRGPRRAEKARPSRRLTIRQTSASAAAKRIIFCDATIRRALARTFVRRVLLPLVFMCSASCRTRSLQLRSRGSEFAVIAFSPPTRTAATRFRRLRRSHRRNLRNARCLSEFRLRRQVLRSPRNPVCAGVRCVYFTRSGGLLSTNASRRGSWL